MGCSVLAGAQTHKVAKPETVVRAVGVYEWTGDLAKPASSRMVPVTLFIDGQLQDAGVYLARPVPMALLTGNIYEMQQAGVAKGTLELSFARHMQMTEVATGATAYDDGWFGYGSFKGPAAVKKAPPLKASKTMAEVTSSKDDGRPHFSNKSGGDSGTDAKGDSGKTDSDKTGSSGSGSASTVDADRPTMKRRSGSSSDSSGTASTDTGAVPADDPDRPHLSKKSGSDSSGTDSSAGSDPASGPGSGSGSGGGTTTAGQNVPEGGSANDPDRPTLKRRTADEIKRDRKQADSASVTGVGSLNDDPNRPTMRRGKPTSAMNEDDLPKMMGLPVDLKQMVAVSDAVNRPVHDFARPWEDDAERSAILMKMEGLARAKLAEYGAVAAPVVAVTPEAKPATAAAARRAAAAAKKKAVAVVAPVIALQDEELKGFTLSYGGLATFVYTAHTVGTGATLDYVTVVAQADPAGALQPAIVSATDATHLDRTPRMRLVDAVDAEASNRASLLFELRGQRSRQFGLYSVIGARADQRFLSGTTQ